MFQLFRKSKFAIGTVLTVLALTVVMTVCGAVMGERAKSRFGADGYILSVNMAEEGTAVPSRISFASGTSMSRKASSEIQFANEEGQMVRADADRFVHYSDESITSVNGMLLTDLERFPEGIMDSYYLDAFLTLQNGDHTYTIENNTTRMSFQNFLLKTGESNYLVASESLVLKQGGSEDVIDNGFLELEYLDEQGLVLNATDGENAWQFLSDGSSVTLANGAVLNLGRMELNSGVVDEETGKYLASVALGSLEVSTDGGIQIASSSGWTAPTFILHAVDGQDGMDGSEGLAGEPGEAGEDGGPGEDGAAGAAGTDGSNGGRGGDGKRGATGADGENTDEDENLILAQTPFVNITSWDQTAGSVDFKLCSYNTSLIQEGTTEAYLLNVATGAVVKTWNMELKTDDGVESAWNADGLAPGTEYKLIISARVLKSGDDENPTYAKSILLSRTFTTDENGFYLKKVHGDYITFSNVGEYDEGKAVPDKACLGFTLTLSGGQKLDKVTNVDISYVDKKTGQTVTLKDSDNPLADDGERGLLAGTAVDGSVYYLFGLESDTDYTITVEAELINGKTARSTDTYRTLKATPTVVGAAFDVNENRFFISSAWLHQDKDKAVVSYTHEIYRYYSGQGMTGDCLKRKTTVEPKAYIYLSDSIRAGRDDVGAAYEYGNRVYVTWFDNEKYVTKEVAQRVGWRAQSISDSDSSYIQLENEEITAGTMSADLVIYPGAGKSIYVGDKDVHRILVQITSSGTSRVLYYSNLNGWTNAAGTPLSGTVISGSAVLPLELTGLSADTTYVITVTGYFSPSANTGRTVGSTMFKTESN